jgi:hypothetical protein
MYMEILIFIIPFVTALILLWFYRAETAWWEYLALLVPSILLGLLFEFIFKKANVSDTEYLGDYVVKLRHEDPWNEWIKKTCSRRVRCGGTAKHPVYRTVHYDCSYCEEHPDRWLYYTASGQEVYTDAKTWYRMRNRLKAPEVFIDMHRHYHTRDGDAQEHTWAGDWKRSWPLTWSHHYDNPVLGSRSLFRLDPNPDPTGLYEYPEITSDQDQHCLLGQRLTPREDLRLRWLNAKLGKSWQFRLYTLVWSADTVGPEIATRQRDYWAGGNKNEVVMCLGISPKDGRVEWARGFGWSDSPELQIRLRQYLEGTKFNPEAYAGRVESLVKSGIWKRKHFEDFDYLSVELTDTQATILLILILLYNIGISVWIVTNEYRNDS